MGRLAVSLGLSVVGKLRKYWVWGALLLLTVPAWSVLLQRGYFSMHDDLQAMRQMEMDKCFADGQIPCRWVPDLGYGYGYPLFNYYPPFPYLIGQGVHFLGWSFTDTVKVVGILGFLVSAVTMYLLAREFWGKWGGLVSAIFYVYAPYHAADFYVRAAVNEFWAIAWFPAILWAAYRLIKENTWRWVPVLAVFYSLLMLSHNGMMMIFTVGLVGWVGMWMVSFCWKDRVNLENWGSRLVKLVVAGIWAVALAGFFFLPVVFEQKFVHVETLVMGYFNYLAHFADLNQLFIERTWGFGESRFGPDDDMSFQIGHLHWILGMLGVVLLVGRWIRGLGGAGRLRGSGEQKVQSGKFQARVEELGDRRVLAGGYVFWLTLGYAFMSHYRSAAIWKAVKPLEYLQFPWRFLAVMILGTSFLVGAGVYWLQLRGKWELAMAATGVLLVAVILFNFEYFKPRAWWPQMNDERKFSGESWRLQVTSGIFDYLPIYLPLPPVDPPPADVEILGGRGEVERVVKRSNYQEYRVKLAEGSEGGRVKVRLNTFYFPEWKYFWDGEEAGDYKLDENLGVPEFELLPGEYELVAKFTDTPVRKAGNVLSLVGWAAVGVWVAGSAKLFRIFPRHG